MVSTTGVAENDDSEACDIIFQTGHLITLPQNNDSEAFDSILQIGHRFPCNGVQQEF